jgi:chromosome transmission fidelity protein 18
MPNFLQ